MIRDLSTIDRDICQPLGRILQEAFADGFTGTGTVAITRTVTADPADGLSNGQFQHITVLNAPLTNSVIVGAEVRLLFGAGVTALGLEQYANTAFRVRIDEYGDDQPNIFGCFLSGISFEYYLDETGGAPSRVTPLHVAAGAYKWDGLFNIQTNGDCGDATCSNPTTQDDALDKRIPVFFGGLAYPHYIRCYKTEQ